MALGYQRIHDLSPLSLKLLNDQLEQLWKKMMGGMTTRDMTPEVATAINQAVTEGRFTSLIEQHAEEIRLAVGSSGGENLIKNGDAAFGLDSWAAQDCALAADGGRFEADGAGVIRQEGIPLIAGASYVLAFRFRCEAGVWAGIDGQQGQQEAAQDEQEYRLGFIAQQDGEAAVELHFAGAGQFWDAMLYRSDGGFRQNPNEMRNASVSLSDGSVQIDTHDFVLRLRDGGGQAVTEMSADEQGFSKLYVSENIVLRGREYYLGEGQHHLWVHPDAARYGERRIFRNSGAEPPTLEGCFADIQEAVDFLPRWVDGEAVIHIHGGSAWQYPTGWVTVANFYGGGQVRLVPWGAAHYTLKRVEVLNNALVVDIVGADVISCGTADCFRARNSVAMLYDCRVEGRYLLTGAGSAGYDAAHGALMLLTSCQAHHCQTAAHAHMGGRIYAESCAGTGNYAGLMATTGGIAQQAHTTFEATTPYFEGTGGIILSRAPTVALGTAPDSTPLEYSARFVATATGCMDRDKKDWVTAPDWVRAGPQQTGCIWFDLVALRATIGTRPIVHASLHMRRRGMGGRAGSVEVTLTDLLSTAPSGLYMAGAARGAIGRWRWGEKKGVSLPIAAAQALARRQSNGFALSANEEMAFEGISEHPPVLEIVYR